MPGPLVEFQDVHKAFGKLVVLSGVSLKVHSGESVVVIGASGTGKSVLLKHIVGLLMPDDGAIFFDGMRVDHMKRKQLMLVRKRIGFLFQMGALFDSLTVGENIAFPLQEHTGKSAVEVRDVVAGKLAMVGLTGIEGKMPGELSGGQKKRVALARAIALEPELILYDEPTTGLDPIRSDVINELILKLKHELNVASVVVTHDMNSAFKVADRIVMLDKGKLIIDGPPKAIQDSDNDVVRRFVVGEASEQELAGLRGVGQRSPDGNGKAGAGE